MNLNKPLLIASYLIWVALPAYSQYDGSGGSGFDTANASGLLEGGSLTMYEGGVGSGFAHSVKTGLLDGEMLTMYFGGVGDGHHVAQTTVALSEFCQLIVQVDDDPIISGTYEAEQQILSQGKVRDGYNVLFQAGESILLQNNFEVESNAIFEILIATCISSEINN